MQSSVADVWFSLQGTHAPSLHAHALYGAICSLNVAFHGADWLGIHTLHGEREGDRAIRLLPGTRLGLRMPVERLGDSMTLVGQAVDLNGHRLILGVPEIHPLTPHASLSARMVTVKGFQDSDSFATACRRQLDELGVAGNMEVGPRLIQPIHEKKVVGFAMRIHELSDEDSLRIQAIGIGGRRRFGCGLFRRSLVGRPA